MIINPTQKTQILFNKVPAVADKKIAKGFSEVNPFFSWHANFYTKNRKKFLILVNDLTYMPIVIGGVDATRKKELSSLIPKAIYQIFTATGISERDAATYLRLAGPLEVNAGFNRTVTGVINVMLEHAKMLSSTLTSDEGIDIQISLILATSFVKATKPIEELHKAFLNPSWQKLKEVKVVDEVKTKSDEYVIERTWQRINEVKWDFDKADGLTAAQQNNQLILTAFQTYLEQADKLAQKTVKKHVETINYFLNEFAPYRSFNAITKNYSVIGDFIGWYTRVSMFESETSIKRIGAALKKFYKFLIMANEIDKKDWADIRDEIEVGVSSALMTVEWF